MVFRLLKLFFFPAFGYLDWWRRISYGNIWIFLTKNLWDTLLNYVWTNDNVPKCNKFVNAVKYPSCTSLLIVSVILTKKSMHRSGSLSGLSQITRFGLPRFMHLIPDKDWCFNKINRFTLKDFNFIDVPYN